MQASTQDWGRGGPGLACCQSKPELGSSSSCKNRFCSGAIAVGEKRRQYRTVRNSKYSMDMWGFITRTRVGGQWTEK